MMNSVSLLIASLVALAPVSSFAQTKPQSGAQRASPKAASSKNPIAESKNEVKPSDSKSSETLLQKAKREAQAEIAVLEQKLAQENAKTSGNNVCVTNALSWQLRSSEWFIQNYSAFEKMESDYDASFGAILGEANQKWTTLRTSEISTLAVKGQKQQEVPVSFDTMVEYLKNYNSKYAACVPSQRRDLRKVQNDPHQNKYGIAIEQMVEAVKLMTANINASLKDNPNQFQLVFAEDACGFKLVFQAQFDHNGKKEAISFDALSLTGNTLSISEEVKWARLLKDNPRIANVETDGALRLKQFEAESKLTSCERGFAGKIPAALVGKPFQTFTAVQAEIDHEIAMGARTKTSSGFAGVGSNTQDWTEVVSSDPKQSFQSVAQKLDLASDGTLYAQVSGDLYQFAGDKWSKFLTLDNDLSVVDLETSIIATKDGTNVRLRKGNNTCLYFGITGGVSSLLAYKNSILYYVGVNQKLYMAAMSRTDCYNGAYPDSTTELSQTRGDSLSFTPQGVYGVSEGVLVKLNPTQKTWEPVAGAEFDVFGSDVVEARVLSSTDMYVLTRNGDIFHYANRQWQHIASSSGENRIVRFAANTHGKVCGVGFNGKIWTLNAAE